METPVPGAPVLDKPDFDPATSSARTLALVVHGFSWPQTIKEGVAFVLKGFRWPSRVKVDGLVAAVREEYAAGGVDVYAPEMPYSNLLDTTGANDIVVALKEKLDDIWARKPGGYDRVVLVGHSMGGVLLRRVFLCGSPRPPDYAGEWAARDDLAATAPTEPAGWAEKVERLVLIATWDKGWSISQRDSWFYSLALNGIGFLGHVTPEKGKWAFAKAAFDMRRGAAFIVQTRMLWMAYRRWHNVAHDAAPLDLHRGVAPGGADPLVVQVIGTDDDFVSPQNQVDNDVNGAPKDDPRPRYFLLEMTNTNHAGAVDLTGEAGREREKVIRAALSRERFEIAPAGGSPDSAPPFASDPAAYDDGASPPDPDVKHVAFVIHGIRDDGFWTHRIAKAIKETAARSGDPAVATLRSITATYGYFAMLPFILPWVRRQKVEWFMDLYVTAKARFPNARFHYVGHSNGTYLAARALTDYSAARFGHVYFAGSVVRPDYPWRERADARRVERFHNVRGATDWVVALGPKSVDYVSEDLGSGGFDGFRDASAAGAHAITQSAGCAWGGHGGAIGEGHWPGIARFIVTGERPPEPAGLFTPQPHKILDYVTRARFVGLPLAAIGVATLVVWLVEALFACDDGGSYLIPYYCVLLLALASAGLFFLFPNRPPDAKAYAILRWVTIVAGLFLGGWFTLKLLALVFFQCGYALQAVFFVGVLALIRFVSTRF